MERDVYDASLDTHKLSGKLSGLYASSCGYDCRILFTFEKDENREEIILLIFVGKHDAVY